MQTERLRRPTLKITLRVDPRQTSSFVFEVWNPFAGLYQQVDSVADGLRRVEELSRLIWQMWQSKHPRQTMLEDVPEPDGTGRELWAEFRVNPTTKRSFETRRKDRTGWLKADSMLLAAETICAKVGCEYRPSATV
jgi:hypothetical protein